LEFEFNSASTYPAEYDDALFFADYSRDCIWVMPKGADGHPAPGQIRPFVEAAANPVNLEMGPDGNLYYVDFDGGTIRRIRYVSANQPPTAVASATPTSGNPPLTVGFDGTAPPTPTPVTPSATPGTWTATAPTTTPRRPSQPNHLHRPIPRTIEQVPASGASPACCTSGSRSILGPRERVAPARGVSWTTHWVLSGHDRRT